MKLILMRHGEASSSNTDSGRPLSAHGRNEVNQVAARLKKQEIRVNTIFHSTKLRAKQTAEIVAEHLGDLGLLKEREGLAPNDPVESIATWLENVTDNSMLVGHLPFMPTLSAQLLGGPDNHKATLFPTAGVVILSRDPDGLWHHENTLSPTS